MLNTLLTHTPLFYLIQSLWRDEAFSILAAQRSLGFLFTKLGFEPPVYYMLLHFWVRIFGESEVATRSLSLLGFVLATAIVIEWSGSMFKKHWLAWFTPLFFFLNPMLLYYAFEVRTYGWYIFFGTATLYTYAHKKWALFALSAILGFYTHTYFLFYFLAIGVHWLLTEYRSITRSWKAFFQNKAVRAFFIVGLAILPWIIKIIQEAPRLKSSWYFPVDMHLIYSVLGNMFIGYEGTPWYGWVYTKYLSLGILAFAALALKNKQERKRNGLFLLGIIVPLGIVLGISFVKPLFVNRYLIPVTVSMVLMIATAIQTIRISWMQKIVAVALLSTVLWINWWFPPEHAKLPIRDTMTQINTLRKSTDTILAASPIIYLEVKYYAADRSRVFLYNPTQGVFPWYVGDAVITSSDMITELPLYPARAFLVHDDGSYEIVYRMPVTAPQKQAIHK